MEYPVDNHKNLENTTLDHALTREAQIDLLVDFSLGKRHVFEEAYQKGQTFAQIIDDPEKLDLTQSQKDRLLELQFICYYSEDVKYV